MKYLIKITVLFSVISILFANINCKKEVNKPPYHPVAIYPEHNAVINHIPEKLSWYCNDPEQDIVVCDLYFGENNPPELLASELNVFEFSDLTIESQKTYFWKIVGTDTFNNTTEGDVWIFTVGNLPPETPTNPIPENNSVDQPATTLSWECIEAEGEVLTYDIYFGTDDTPDLIAEDVTESTYTLPELTGNQKYYWRIKAKDSYGNIIAGPLWNFSTGLFAPKLLFPEENAINAPWYPILKWTCDNTEDLTYDVYLGINDNPELLVSGITDTTFYSERLMNAQTYYWKIVAKDTDGSMAESLVWSFTVFGNPVFGMFTDDRDGTIYNAVTIGDQIWMAENLKYNVEGSKVYDDDPLNEEIYGRLYTWEHIMNGEEASNENPSGVQGIAPEGWHIPSRAEWDELIHFVGGQFDDNIYFNNAGNSLKEVGTEHWLIGNNGDNESGFKALPGGRISSTSGEYELINSQANFWCCSSQETNFGEIYPIRYMMSYDEDYVQMREVYRLNFYSLRCVKN